MGCCLPDVDLHKLLSVGLSENLGGRGGGVCVLLALQRPNQELLKDVRWGGGVHLSIAPLFMLSLVLVETV